MHRRIPHDCPDTGAWIHILVFFMKDEQEAAYWDIFDEMTEDWEKTLEANKEWLMPPKTLPAAPASLPNASTYTSAVTPREDASGEDASVTKEVIGNNSV